MKPEKLGNYKLITGTDMSAGYSIQRDTYGRIGAHLELEIQALPTPYPYSSIDLDVAQASELRDFLDEYIANAFEFRRSGK